MLGCSLGRAQWQGRAGQRGEGARASCVLGLRNSPTVTCSPMEFNELTYEPSTERRITVSGQCGVRQTERRQARTESETESRERDPRRRTDPSPLALRPHPSTIFLVQTTLWTCTAGALLYYLI